MTTRLQAIAAAGRAIAAGITLRDSLPPRAAAEAAWTPTGPPIDELEGMIRAGRGEWVEAAEPASPVSRVRRVRDRAADRRAA